MKKLLLSAAILMGLLFLADFAYKTWKRDQRRTVLTADRAVIFTYIDLAQDDLQDYFSLNDTTFERIKGGYEVACDVEDQAHLHLINNRPASAIGRIDCNEPFDFDRQLEMSKEYGTSAYELRVKLTAPPSSRVIAQRRIHVPWEYGRVNHLIIAKDSAYRYCPS